MRRALLMAALGALGLGAARADEVAIGPMMSAVGLFRASLSCAFVAPVLGGFQTCLVKIEAANDRSASIKGLSVSARVPGIGRIMPTAPRARGPSADGGYRIEGLKFDMAGRWSLALDIDAGAIHDRVAFDIDVK
jgi:hypothetical protein